MLAKFDALSYSNPSAGRGSREALPKDQCPVRHQRRGVQASYENVNAQWAESETALKNL